MTPLLFTNFLGNVWMITGETVEILCEDGEWAPSTLSACQILELENEGQIIKTISNTDFKTIIELKSLSSGVYIIKVRTEKGITVKKFIKQ